MPTIDKNSTLWEYMTPEMRDLALEGDKLLNSCLLQSDDGMQDYSYLVFPWGKLYEGFLKKIFLDLKLITPEDYFGNEVRIGKLLSTGFGSKPPHRLSIIKELSSSKIFGENLTKVMRSVWRNARNTVFHFFPNNVYKLDLETAKKRIQEVVRCMDLVVNRVNSIKK
jgi:hypothetical protein